MKRKLVLLVLTVSLVGMGGCHTTSRRVVGGALIGAAIGGLIGAAADHDDRHGDRHYRRSHRHRSYDYYCD